MSKVLELSWLTAAALLGTVCISGNALSAPPPSGAPQTGAAVPGVEDDLTTVRYEQTIDAGLIKIRARLPYRDLYLRGGPVSGLPSYGSPFRWSFPAISIKLANNTSKTIVLSEAQITNKRSTLLSNALLVWDELSYHQLVMRNEGWGRVVQPKLTIDVAASNACQSWPEASEYAQDIALADFDTQMTVPILDYVPSRFRSASKVCVFGQIAYRDSDGTLRQVKYKTLVRLSLRVTAAMPPTNFYQVLLHGGRSNESIRLPLEQQMLPGTSDHFVITIGADQSAQFDVDVSLKAVSGSVVSTQHFDLEIFLPRSEAKRVFARQ